MITVGKNKLNKFEKKILEWINSGLDHETILSKLQNEFDMPDRTKANKCIRDVKKYNKKLLSCSTTIDQL